MTPQEETVILEARDILGRYLSQNPAVHSWRAARKRYYRELLQAHAEARARAMAGAAPPETAN